MPAQKIKFKVQVSEGLKVDHAAAVQSSLTTSKQFSQAVSNAYPGIQTIVLKPGDRFNVQGYDGDSHTLTVEVNPGSPRTTSQQFKKHFTRPQRQQEQKADHGRLPAVMPPGSESLAAPKIVRGKTTTLKRDVDWPEIVVPEEVSNKLGYQILTIPDRATMREYFEHYFCGVYVKGDDTALTTMGNPVPTLEEANLFAVKMGEQAISFMIGYPFKHDPDAKEVVVPMVGEFYGANGLITPELERKGLVRRVRDDSGNPVTTPAFCKTARQLLFPMHGIITFLKVGDRMILPNSPEAIHEAWDLAMPGGSNLLTQLLDGGGEFKGLLKIAYEQHGAGQAYDEFAAKNRRHLTMIAGMGRELIDMLQKGLRDKGYPLVGMPVDAIKEIEIVKVPMCGQGVKGAGCLNYDGNYVYLDERGKPIKTEHMRVLRKQERTAFVVDERFRDHKGLMLAIGHQPWSSKPVGGDTMTNLLCFGRENLLLKYGAELSYVTTAVIPLLSKDDVPDLCNDNVAIVTNAILDDSRRIGDFTDEDFPVEGMNEAYMAVVVEKYIEETPAKGGDHEQFLRSHFEEAREIHLNRMCTRIGRNLRAMFDAGLTNPSDRDLIGNFSIDGGLCDTIDLADMTHSRQFHSTVMPALIPLSAFYEVAGFNRMDFYRSNHMEIILREALGQEESKRLITEIRSFIKEGEEYKVMNQKDNKAIGLITTAFAKLRGEQEETVWDMSDERFIEFLKGEPALTKELKIAGDSVTEFERSLGTTRMISSRAEISRRRGGPRHLHEVLEEHKPHADMLLRLETAPNMEQQGTALKEQFQREFGEIMETI